MPSITQDAARELIADLQERHAHNHICRPDTRLVVEGYPRSSNSFAVDMIAESAIGILRRRDIGHHTHEVMNLQVADAFGIPKIILIREPEAAILSFHIYSGAPVKRCAEIYVAFYTGALELTDNAEIVHFSEVTDDFRAVVRKINRITGFAIPEDQDFAAIRERALALVQSRASKTSEDDAMRQVAAPNAQRDVIKNQLRGAVEQYLADHPEARQVYDRTLARRAA